MFKSATLTAASLSLAAAFGSHMATPAQAQSVQVATSDLDLSSEKGQRVLGRRIGRASANVCNSSAAHLDSGVRRSERLCREATVRAASAELARFGIVRVASR